MIQRPEFFCTRQFRLRRIVPLPRFEPILLRSQSRSIHLFDCTLVAFGNGQSLYGIHVLFFSLRRLAASDHSKRFSLANIIAQFRDDLFDNTGKRHRNRRNPILVECHLSIEQELAGSFPNLDRIHGY